MMDHNVTKRRSRFNWLPQIEVAALIGFFWSFLGAALFHGLTGATPPFAAFIGVGAANTFVAFLIFRAMQ